MRTTKVKRLWPVMALALVFALVAVLGVSLWHNGATPGGLTPPAAEAQGRAIEADADIDAIDYGDSCAMVTLNQDYTCITGGNSLLVSIAPSTPDNDGLAVYVTGAAGDPNAENGYANIQAKTDTGNLGKRGVGEYLPQRAGTNLAAAKITVQRSWADSKGDVFVVVYGGAESELGETATDLPVDSDTAETDAGIVRVHFTQPIDLNDGDLIQNLGDGNQASLPGKIEPTGTPTPRRIPLADAEGETMQGDLDPGTVGFKVAPRWDASDARVYVGGSVEVATEFTTGSAVKSGVAMTRTLTFPTNGTPEPPDLDDMATDSTIDNVTVTGWEEEGAVNLKVTLTHIALDGTRTDMDPFWLFRAGPADTIEFGGDQAEPTDPHRVTSGTEYSGFGTLEIQDALGLDAAGVTHVIYEGANAAAEAILPEDEEDRMIPIAEAMADAGFSIDIESDAPSGTYDVNFVVKDADDMVLARLSVDIEVIGAPDAMDGAVRENVVNPGGMLELQNVALNSGSQSAYATPCSLQPIASGATHGDTNSICEWAGKTERDRAVLTGGQGKVLTNGTQSIMVKADAAPGTYTIVLSDGRTGTNASGMVADKEVTFMVRGRPANYDLTGPTVGGSVVDRLAPGQIGSFTVTATDVNGNTPYFPEDETADEVFVVVSGDTGSVRTLRVIDGKVTLNQMGMASFQVLVNDNAPSGSIRVTAVGLGDAVDSEMVAIGPLTLGVPTGLTLATEADDTGTVTLAWTAGANSTQHWIAGIKQEDWDAGNLSLEYLLWTKSDSETGHTFTGLDGGKEYVFTVTAGNAAGQWSDWFLPLRRITVGTPAPTGGGGPTLPFAGN